MKVIKSSKVAAPIGPFSQGIDSGSLIFVSGQLPIGLDGIMPADPDAQARQCMENLKAVLEAGGSALNKVVKVTVFLQNMEHFTAVNEIYASYFADVFPARSCVQVARLPKDALVEVEAIALK